MYSVIVGDIIQSRSLGVSDRRKTTVIFDEILEQINKKYQSNIMSSFGIVRGDGFEGVILSQQDIPGIVQDIIKLCWEKGRIKLRICAVVGELSEINLKRDKSDGPAFHKAVQEIDKMKADKSEHWFQVSIITNTIAQPLINSILVLLSTLTEGWTEKQTETVWAMSDHSNKQKLVSQKMNVSLSTVSKHLKSANYAAYNKAWSGIKEYLEAAEDALTERKEDDNKTNTFTSYYGMGLNKNKLNDYHAGAEYINESIRLAKREFGAENSRLVPLYNTLAQSYLDMLSNDEIDYRILVGKNEIESISYSADGKYLASGSEDGIIQIWDTKSGKCLRVLEGHSNRISCVTYGPQGSILASASDDETVRIWDTETGKCCQILEWCPSRIGSVAFSPNGRYLAIGLYDKTVQTYDLESGNRVVFEGHSGRIESIAFSPDGKNLASCSFDNTVRIWNLESQECRMVLSGHSSWVYCVAYSPSGKYIASGSRDKTVRIWDLEKMECVKVLKGYSGQVFDVAYSSNGRYLVSGSSDRSLKIWDLESGECCKSLNGHKGPITSVAYSPDGRYVASGSVDKTVRIWDLRSGEKDFILGKAKKAIDESLKCQEYESHTTIEYARTMNLLGQYFLAAQQYDKALTYFAHSCEIVVNTYGYDHPILESYYNNIALAFEKKGDYKQSIVYYQKSLEIAKHSLGQDPLSYANTLYRVGLCYEELGMYDNAYFNIQKSIDILMAYFPEKNDNTNEKKEALERIKSKLNANAE